MSDGPDSPALLTVTGDASSEVRRLGRQVEELQKHLAVLERSVSFFTSHIGKINQIEAYFDVLEKSAAREAAFLPSLPATAPENEPKTAVERFFQVLRELCRSRSSNYVEQTVVTTSERNEAGGTLTPSSLVQSTILAGTPILPAQTTAAQPRSQAPVQLVHTAGGSAASPSALNRGAAPDSQRTVAMDFNPRSNLATSQSLAAASATSSEFGGNGGAAPPLYQGSFADNLTFSSAPAPPASEVYSTAHARDLETTSAERRYRALAAATQPSSHYAPVARGSKVASSPDGATSSPSVSGTVRSSPSASGRPEPDGGPKTEYIERRQNVPQTGPKFQPSPQVLRQQQSRAAALESSISGAVALQRRDHDYRLSGTTTSIGGGARMSGEFYTSNPAANLFGGGMGSASASAQPVPPERSTHSVSASSNHDPSDPSEWRLQLDPSRGSVRLGNGSWASTYKTADPAKREKLELLYKTGIVSARELEEDHTVVTEDHIHDCIVIANEMLQRSSCEVWMRQPNLAQTFFEHELTKLYTRKFGGKS
ncbi:unnamed protein product [Amoebophrya sp. A120]|nr:unnamed protein product [Amoebophrya sp. A120]|eukprot:GSA120T00003474001.1